ncbi:hypothetical protein AN958_10433 [Leucoagaricus sp. SymC.cos]|nr:hypothetical protein AN958_10433 [Leucoagaricus sp. SymC.cos]
MVSPQPVVLTCLKLPPDEQLFFRLKAILLVVLEKFHQLDLAILAAETRANLSEAQTILSPLHIQAGSRSSLLIHAIDYAKDFGGYFIELAGSMANPSAMEDIKDNLAQVSASALLTARKYREGERDMKNKVSEEIEPTVRKVTAVLNRTSTDASSLVFTPENLEAVNELIQVTREYSTIHGEISKYFEEMERVFDPQSFQVATPSDEEITTVKERWRGYIQTVTDLQRGLRGIQANIDAGPSAADALRLAQEMAAKGSSANQESATTNRKAIADSSHVTADSASQRQPLRARLRAFSHRVFSCISLKHFG